MLPIIAMAKDYFLGDLRREIESWDPTAARRGQLTGEMNAELAKVLAAYFLATNPCSSGSTTSSSAARLDLLVARARNSAEGYAEYGQQLPLPGARLGEIGREVTWLREILRGDRYADQPLLRRALEVRIGQLLRERQTILRQSYPELYAPRPQIPGEPPPPAMGVYGPLQD
jgi:hypothetical protein